MRLFLVGCLLGITGGSSQGWVSSGLKWPEGTIVMNVQLQPDPVTLLDSNTSWTTVAVGAMTEWNSHISEVQFNYNTNSNPVASGDNINSISWGSTFFGRSFPSGTLAITSYQYSGSTITEADVTFNSGEEWNSYRGSLRTAASGEWLNDFFRVALHELGHVLGLDHPDEFGQSVTAQMNSTEGDLDILAPDDITGAQSIYAAPAWAYNRSYGWLYNHRNGWFGSADLGWLWVSTGGWAWSTNLKGWLYGDGNKNQLWSIQYRWLYSSADGDSWYYSSTLGWLYIGDFNGWVWTSRFGWVWPNGDGQWFFSNAYGWISANGSGGVWGTAQGRWL